MDWKKSSKSPHDHRRCLQNAQVVEVSYRDYWNKSTSKVSITRRANSSQEAHGSVWQFGVGGGEVARQVNR